MKKQLKTKEKGSIKEIEYPQKELYKEEEIPPKDEDGIDDIIPKKYILESLDKTLTIKTNALS